MFIASASGGHKTDSAVQDVGLKISVAAAAFCCVALLAPKDCLCQPIAPQNTIKLTMSAAGPAIAGQYSENIDDQLQYSTYQLTGVPITSKFTYSSLTNGITGFLINEGVLTEFSAAHKLPDINPGVTYLPLQLINTGVAVNAWFIASCQNAGAPTIPVTYWFTMGLGTSGNWYNTTTNWTGTFLYQLSLCLDPTKGEILYDGPNLSEIDFSPKSTDLQSTFLNYGFGAAWIGSSNVPNIIAEGIAGIDTGPNNNGNYGPPAPLTVSSLVISRAAATCGPAIDPIVAEYQASYLWDKHEEIVEWAPGCSDFTSVGKTANYSFLDLNTSDIQHSDYTYALLRYAMMVPSSYGYGLDAWANQIAMTATDPSLRLITSAYRSPSVNELKKGSFQPGHNSRHMFGDAVDLANKEGNANHCTPTRAKQPGACCVTPNVPPLGGGTCTGAPGTAMIEYEQLLSAAMAAGADYEEPVYYYNKLHHTYTPSPCFLGCVHADWRNHLGLYEVNPP